MRQDFSRITDEQLAALFPIVLEEHNPHWKEQYYQEKTFMQTILKDQIIRMSHIGSTSIPGLLAKPTIDTLIEVSETVDFAALTETMLDYGYIVMYPQKDLSAFFDTIAYFKGYTPQGFQGTVVHNHIRQSGDWGELYFRDYLKEHPDIAALYAQLKIGLKEQFEYDRDAYTKAKGDFVYTYTEQARLAYPGRYKPE